ncbi:NAD-dependent epimerase [Legionella impletisoli]|nr:NAD-dependent epimerase [Legionella impletisoli]
MRLLITGCAGFIGYHLAKARLEMGDQVIGMDNLNDYYDVRLKQARLELLQSHPSFHFYERDICNLEQVTEVFKTHKPERVVNLAAQAGVRYSLQNPLAYIQSNVVGFTNIIEACRHHHVEHLVYASTSSVYGANESQPYREKDGTAHPLTIYAASKKANELIAHSYSHLYQLPTTGLRFFTVYGPWGRPDMAFFTFTRDILQGIPIKIFNQGQMQRDFTYIDDIVMGLSLAIDKIPKPDSAWSAMQPDPSRSHAPYRIYNIGNGNPVNLMDYIRAIETATGKEAIKEFMPMQKGDVLSTHADTTALHTDFGYLPKISVEVGVAEFVKWYRTFYNV